MGDQDGSRLLEIARYQDLSVECVPLEFLLGFGSFVVPLS